MTLFYLRSCAPRSLYFFMALQNGSCDSTPFGLPEQQKWPNQAVERLLSYDFLPSLTCEVTI
jgi:hypothetical protein